MGIHRLPLPEGAPRLRLVESEASDYQMEQVVEGLSRFTVTANDLAGALQRLHAGDRLTEGDALLSGDSIIDAASGLLALINLSGASNRDRDLGDALRRWLDANGA